MARPLDEAFKKLLQALRPMLAARGFRLQGATARKVIRPGIVQIINFQRSPWNSEPEGTIAVNLAIFHRLLFEHLEWPIPVVEGKERESDCLIRSRASMARDDHDVWIAFESGAENADALAALTDLVTFGFTWLDENLDLNVAVKFWEKAGYDFMTAAIYYTAGLNDRARAAVDRGLTDLKDRPDLLDKLVRWKEKRGL